MYFCNVYFPFLLPSLCFIIIFCFNSQFHSLLNPVSRFSVVTSRDLIVYMINLTNGLFFVWYFSIFAFFSIFQWLTSISLWNCNGFLINIVKYIIHTIYEVFFLCDGNPYYFYLWCNLLFLAHDVKIVLLILTSSLFRISNVTLDVITLISTLTRSFDVNFWATLTVILYQCKTTFDNVDVMY